MDSHFFAKNVNATEAGKRVRWVFRDGDGGNMLGDAVSWRGLITNMHPLFDIIAPSFNCVLLVNLGAISQFTSMA